MAKPKTTASVEWIEPAPIETADDIVVIKELIKRREQGGVAFELVVPDLRLPRGAFVAIVGESGCGKSTLLDLLALVMEPSACTAFEFHLGSGAAINVKALWAADDEGSLAAIRRNHLGYVLQTGGLLPFLTVEQNIGLPARLKGCIGYQADVRALAKHMDVETVLQKKPQFLSGGQRQRVAILRALVHGPDIILADEPTAAVDKARAASIVAHFCDLAKARNTTSIMVTTTTI